MSFSELPQHGGNRHPFVETSPRLLRFCDLNRDLQKRSDHRGEVGPVFDYGLRHAIRHAAILKLVPRE